MKAFAASISAILIVCAFSGSNAFASNETYEGNYGVPVMSLSERFYLSENIATTPLIFAPVNLTFSDAWVSSISNLRGPQTLFQAPMGNKEISTYPGQANEKMRPNAIGASIKPLSSDAKKLNPWNIDKPNSVYFNNKLMTYGVFTDEFPGILPALWTNIALGWTQYAVCVKGTWMKVALFTPSSGSLDFYEIKPDGIIAPLRLKSSSSGYYYIWYEADRLGRHIIFFNINGKVSNAIAIDVVENS